MPAEKINLKPGQTKRFKDLEIFAKGIKVKAFPDGNETALVDLVLKKEGQTKPVDFYSERSFNSVTWEGYKVSLAAVKSEEVVLKVEEIT